MARFYNTVRNGRGGEQSAGGRSSVEESHTRGWDVGVRVSTNNYNKNEPDELRIYATAGSNGGGPDKFIGTVARDPQTGEPQFIPA